MANEISSTVPQPTRVAPPSTPGPTGLGTLAVGVVCVAALYLGREVFIPLVLAVLLSFVLAPVVNILRHVRVPRVPAILVTVAFALSLILAVGGVIGLQIADLAGQLPQYQHTVETKIGKLRTGVLGHASALIHKATVAMDQNVTAPGGNAAPSATQDPSAPKEKPLLVRLPQQEPSSLVLAQKILEPILSPLTTLGIVLVVVIFLLMQREDLRDRMIRLFGSSDLHRTTVAMDDAAGRLSTYFLTQLGINTAFGVIIAVGLFFIGVPSPILWGVLGTLLRFVPYIGSAISALLPIALAAAVSPGWGMAIATGALFLVTETIMGQAIEPLLYGHSTGLSPFAVIVSALFWSWLWGPIGLILSTPFTVLLVVLGRHVEHLEFLDVLLGDRPALTPVENFYQRILAGDPDEARDHAELLLKDRPLIAYYDDVALRGLQLAAADAQRGVLGGERLQTIKSAVQDLVGDLGRLHDDSPGPAAPRGNADVPTMAEQSLPLPLSPPPVVSPNEVGEAWRHDDAVLCIAGRGALDEAGASILAQLLQKHGLGARILSNEAVSRRGIETLQVSNVAMVCVVYLEVKGNPSHLRYLVQRLHDRLPGRPILVGLWPERESVLSDKAMQRELGADLYVSTLQQSVEACLQEARRTGADGATAASSASVEAS